MDKTRVYISGPISGVPPEKVRAAFDEAAMEILRLGGEPVDPSRLPEPAGQPQHHDYLRRDLEELSNCDLMVLLDGWWNSSGCLREFWFASQQVMTWICRRNMLETCLRLLEIRANGAPTLDDDAWEERVRQEFEQEGPVGGPFLRMCLVGHFYRAPRLEKCGDENCPILFHSGNCLNSVSTENEN